MTDQTGDNKKILIISPFFSPNLGGVETHLDDLVQAINKNNLQASVLTYSPLTTKTSWNKNEIIGKVDVHRIWLPGFNLFHKFEKYPIIDFLYIAPLLLIFTFFWVFFHKNQYKIIHSHGFNACVIGFIINKIFNITHITQIHAIYENINNSIAKILPHLLNSCQHVLCLSNKSAEQIRKLGVANDKIKVYRYWVNQDIFYPANTVPEQFSVLFVGRLIKKKGIMLLPKLAKLNPNIKFTVIGTGPEENKIKNIKLTNFKYIGKVNNIDLPNYYRQSSILIIPSLYPEGFGRVIIEALSCGLPVVGSNLGSIPESVPSNCGLLVKPTITNFSKAINILKNKKLFSQYRQQAIKTSKQIYSDANFQLISQYY